MNDLPDLCKQFAKVCLFADDTKLCKHVTYEDHLSLQMGLNALQEWSDKWLLKLNINKCKIVSYGRNLDSKYQYYLASAELEKVDEIKDLWTRRLRGDLIGSFQDF